MTIEAYQQDDLTIEVDASPTHILLRWRGKSRARDPGATLGPFLDRAAEAARSDGLTLELALAKLDYVNSATLAALIKAIQRARARKVQVEITYDAAIGWQARSVDALRILEESDGLVRFRSAGS